MHRNCPRSCPVHVLELFIRTTESVVFQPNYSCPHVFLSSGGVGGGYHVFLHLFECQLSYDGGALTYSYSDLCGIPGVLPGDEKHLYELKEQLLGKGFPRAVVEW